MKKTYSKLILMALAVVMLLSVLPATALAADNTEVWLDPNPGWKESGARFAVYYWFDGGDAWIDMTADGDYYKASVPNNATGMIICRMNPGATENDWGNKWNQTGNLTVPTDGKTCFSLPYGNWDNADGSNWYVKGQEPYNDGQTGPISYYVAGDSALCGSNWNEKDEANKMTDIGGGKYEKSYENVPAGNYQLKVTNGTWADAVGGDGPGGNYPIALDQASDVKITFDSNAKTIAVTVTPVGPAPTEHTVTIHFMAPDDTWGDTINAWVWAGEADLPGYEEYHAQWPGKAVEADANNPGWYTLVIKTTYPSFSFIFSGAEGKQTADLNSGEITADTEVWYVGDTGHDTKPTGTPETGDSTPLALLITLLAVSAVALPVLFSKKKAI